MLLKGPMLARACAHTFAAACLQLTGRRLGNSIHIKVAEEEDEEGRKEGRLVALFSPSIPPDTS